MTAASVDIRTNEETGLCGITNGTIANGIATIAVDDRPASAQAELELEALVVGGGFSGVGALYKLRRQGLNVKLFEAGSDFGGVWYWNRYPGARTDSEIPLYQLSTQKIWDHWNWKELFPASEEFRAYFKHIDQTLDLRKDSYFNAKVNSVYFDGQRWVVGTEDGRVARCKFLILATGSSHKTYTPAFPGLEKYQGSLIHAAAFPEEELDFKGKKAALIGSGATGVQIIQVMAKLDCQLTAFIRTPSVCVPMNQRKLTVHEQDTSKCLWGSIFEACKTTRSGFAYGPGPGSFYAATEEERKATLETLWVRGGMSFFLGNYREWLTDPHVNRYIYEFWLSKVRPKVKDPVKRDIVAPLKMPYYLGTKRPSLEQDYYESIDRPNVEIVDLKSISLKEFTSNGIVTSDGKLREFDVVVLATGYDNVTGSLMDLNVRDKNSVSLQEKWKSGIYTHLGLCIPGMPNMFMVYSPQSPVQLANGPPVTEAQVDWICDAIRKMKESGITAVEAQQEAAETWRNKVQDTSKGTLLPLTDSWYNGGNIPGKIREQLVYLGGLPSYEKAIRDALDGWKGFDVYKIPPTTS